MGDQWPTQVKPTHSTDSPNELGDAAERLVESDWRTRAHLTGGYSPSEESLGCCGERTNGSTSPEAALRTAGAPGRDQIPDPVREGGGRVVVRQRIAGGCTIEHLFGVDSASLQFVELLGQVPEFRTPTWRPRCGRSVTRASPD